VGKQTGPGEVVPTTPTEHAIGETFRDCTENCPDMIAVQAGSFMMGAAATEQGRSPAEQPQHRVQIGHAFAVSKYEITFDDWDACALEGGCNGYMPKDGGWGRGKRPVIFVSWDDAKAYVDWLRQKTGKSYRLLTEAEWEYAARAGTTTPYATGATITTAQADFDASASGGKQGAYAGKTVDVGSFPPNPYGLFDMAGNVWEWVEDCWNPTEAGAPSDGSVRAGDCARRVLKGGAWYFEATYLRAAARTSYPKTSRLNVAGFRVARTLE
jgi:formylglycine-generating enzyme required for sulfatase activity